MCKEINMKRADEILFAHRNGDEFAGGVISEVSVSTGPDCIYLTVFTSKGVTLVYKVTDYQDSADTSQLPKGLLSEPLQVSMDNVIASRLGAIATEAGDPNHTGVGDIVDRGLILRRLLEEQGFYLVTKS